MTSIREMKLLAIAEKTNITLLTQEEWEFLTKCRNEQIEKLKQDVVCAEAQRDKIQKSVNEYHSYKMDLLEDIQLHANLYLSEPTVAKRVELMDKVFEFEKKMSDYWAAEQLSYSR